MLLWAIAAPLPSGAVSNSSWRCFLCSSRASACLCWAKYVLPRALYSRPFGPKASSALRWISMLSASLPSERYATPRRIMASTSQCESPTVRATSSAFSSSCVAKRMFEASNSFEPAAISAATCASARALCRPSNSAGIDVLSSLRPKSVSSESIWGKGSRPKVVRTSGAMWNVFLASDRASPSSPASASACSLFSQRRRMDSIKHVMIFAEMFTVDFCATWRWISSSRRSPGRAVTRASGVSDALFARTSRASGTTSLYLSSAYSDNTWMPSRTLLSVCSARPSATVSSATLASPLRSSASDLRMKPFTSRLSTRMDVSASSMASSKLPKLKFTSERMHR
eukprot:PhM_4_TR1061/c0_g1_i1/m.83408